MQTINIHEAEAHWFQLVEQVAGGKPLLITISGTPRVMVLPLDSTEATPLRRVGLFERCFIVAEAVDPSAGAEVEPPIQRTRCEPRRVDAADRLNGHDGELSASVAAHSSKGLKRMYGPPITQVSINAMPVRSPLAERAGDERINTSLGDGDLHLGTHI